MKIVNPTDLKLNDEVVIEVKRVSKATTGGRRMRFRTIVVVGDGKGHLGIGYGRANEVAAAVNKAKDSAKKQIFKTWITLCTLLPPPRFEASYARQL